MNYFQIPDPVNFFGEIFFHYLQNPCCSLYETGVLLKLIPETISSKKKVCLVLLPPFYIGLRIRDEKILESGIKHSGSATLQQVNESFVLYFYFARGPT
jgi:hypothetical protein